MFKFLKITDVEKKQKTLYLKYKFTLSTHNNNKTLKHTSY